jgi:O-antigen/teichoic acid export membrane protein
MNTKRLEGAFRAGWGKVRLRWRVVATASSSMALNAVRALISLITVPIILHGYGEAGLSIWLLLLSLIGLLSYFSSGLSSATITAIGSVALDRRGEVAKQIIAAFLLSAIMAGLYLVIFFLLFSLLDVYSLLNVGDVLGRSQFDAMIVILAISIAAQQVLFTPKFALIGLGEGYKGITSEAAGRILSCAVIAGLAMAHSDLKWLVAAFIVIPALASGIIGLFALWGRLHGGAGQLRGAIAELRDLGREAFRLAVAQASFALSTHSDITLISILAGPLAGVGYGVAQRLFAAPLLCMQAISTALWPEISRANASGNRQWIKAVADKGTWLSVTMSIVSAATLFLFYEPITRLWLGDKAVGMDVWLVLGMAFWLVLTGFNVAQSMVLRALKETRLLLRSNVTMSILNILLSTVLITLIGAPGAIWGTAIAVLICLIIPYRLRIRALWDNER